MEDGVENVIDSLADLSVTVQHDFAPFPLSKVLTTGGGRTVNLLFFLLIPKESTGQSLKKLRNQSEGVKEAWGIYGTEKGQ